MQRYSLSGFYVRDGIKDGLEGIIDVGKIRDIGSMGQGTFKGEVIDCGSASKEQRIRGEVIVHGEDARLAFLEFPRSAHIADVLYELEGRIAGIIRGRDEKEYDLSGHYEGQRETLEAFQARTLLVYAGRQPAIFRFRSVWRQSSSKYYHKGKGYAELDLKIDA